VSVLLLARIQFARDSTLMMTSRDPADSLLPMVRLEPIPLEPGRVFDNADEELDEKPRLLPCGRDWGTITIPQGADALAVISGDTELEFIILPNGRPDQSSARILRATNQMVAREVLTSYMSCRFAPGRVRGQTVAVRVRVR
jgi:hypothetical protein